MANEYYDKIQYNMKTSRSELNTLKLDKKNQQIPASLKGFVKPSYLRKSRELLQDQMVQFMDLVRYEHASHIKEKPKSD